MTFMQFPAFVDNILQSSKGEVQEIVLKFNLLKISRDVKSEMEKFSL